MRATDEFRPKVYWSDVMFFAIAILALLAFGCFVVKESSTEFNEQCNKMYGKDNWTVTDTQVDAMGNMFYECKLKNITRLQDENKTYENR